MSTDTYKEINKPSYAIYKQKGSKFIAYAYPVFNKKNVQEKLEYVKQKEHSARHHCYAYILNSDKSEQRINDDGEPSYTAGKPILNQILSYDLTNILIVVVRYFGGVKLGVPGLINAYKTASFEAISKTKIITKKITEEYEIKFNYIKINTVMRIIKKYNLKIKETNYQQECKINISINKNEVKKVIDILNKNHEIKIKAINH